MLLSASALLAAAPAAAWSGERSDLLRPAARPTGHDEDGPFTYTVPEAARSPACAESFCVHWVARGADAPDLDDADGVADGDGVPDFIERVLGVALHVHAVENDELGWHEPLSDGRHGGGRGKTDIYLTQLPRSLFGYATTDLQRNRNGRETARQFAYLVLDNDFDRDQYEADPLVSLEITLAHEYCHVLQFGYEAHPDRWFAESTSEWMEDQVYDDIDDYIGWVRHWVHLDDVPLTDNRSDNLYGSVAWNLWLADRYGQGIIRSAWSRAPHIGSFAIGGYDVAIRTAGNSNFSRDFARFAADVAEWRTGVGFPEGQLYVDAPRRGSLPGDGRPLERSLDHTTFQLLGVHAGGGRSVVVQASAPRGVTAGLALIGRSGGERSGHAITRLSFKRNGGPMIVHLGRPGRFERVTAVLINADADVTGYNPFRGSWIYSAEAAKFRVRARVVR